MSNEFLTEDQKVEILGASFRPVQSVVVPPPKQVVQMATLIEHGANEERLEANLSVWRPI